MVTFVWVGECWRQECRSLPVCGTSSAWHRAHQALHCRFPQMPREPGGEQASALPVLSEKHATSVSSNYKEKMNHISSLCPWWHSGCWKAAVSRSFSSLLPGPLLFHQLHFEVPWGGKTILYQSAAWSMNFYLQFAPMMFLLQLALAILHLIHPVTFQVQLPFVLLPEQTQNAGVVTITPCCTFTIWKEEEKYTGMGKIWCELGTPCDQQYWAERAHLECGM